MKHPLEVARTNAGLTLDQLAEASGVNERTIRRAESFEAVAAETREKLAGALGVEVEALWPPVVVGSVVASAEGAYRVTAVASDGSYIVQPVNFGPNEVLTTEEIKQRFGVTIAGATQPAAARKGWEALAAASHRNAWELERAEDLARVEQMKVNAAEVPGREKLLDAFEAAQQ